jgi:hypothetical protein
MGAEHKDAEFEGGMGSDLAEGPVEVGVVGARCGDDTDAAPAGTGHEATRGPERGATTGPGV